MMKTLECGVSAIEGSAGRFDALRSLRACELVWDGASFGFDVSAETYLADIHSPIHGVMIINGPMAASEYDDLKLSGFLREDDAGSTDTFRRFSLTDDGRRHAEGRSR